LRQPQPNKMNNINTDKIINDIEKQDIKVVEIGYADLKSIELKGNLESFIATVKVFNENVVFYQNYSFSDDDFLYESDETIFGECDDQPDEDGIDLIQFLPALEEYKSYIGQTSFLIFRVFIK
jgi:hypothetical protein